MNKQHTPAPDLLMALKALLRECANESGAPLPPSREAIAAAQAAVRFVSTPVYGKLPVKQFQCPACKHAFQL